MRNILSKVWQFALVALTGQLIINTQRVLGNMTSHYSTKQFLEEYELEVEKEFEYDGIAATWAPNPNNGSDGGPRFWDTEDEIIPAAESIAKIARREPTLTQALASDGAFLAVATGARIRIYNTESLSMTDELTVGYDEDDYIQKLVFTAKKSSSVYRETPQEYVLADKGSSPEYVLFSHGSEVSGRSGTIHVWNLDAHGRLQQDLRIPSFHPDSIVKNAINTIEDDLSQHGINEEQVGKIQEGFLSTLKAADASNIISKIKTIQDAQFTSFGSSILSHDHEKFLYENHGESTQWGMRPEKELPQVVIMNLEPLHEVSRLKGHTDAIMWAGWSLDDKIVATASWDQTFRIWDAETGVCKHVIGPTEVQNWSGRFLPDGKHLLLSGGRPHPLALYEIETGQKVRSFAPDVKLDAWLRYFAVHPRGEEDIVIIQNDITLLAWQPLHPENPIQEMFAFRKLDDKMRNGFIRIYELGWSNLAQNIFVAKGSEGSVFVWDKSRGLKWRFQRQKGRTDRNGGGVMLVKRKGADWIASLDGDGAVRLWKL